MKRLLLLIAMCICTTNLFAEGRVFCEIREYHTFGKTKKVVIDYGQEQFRGDSMQILVDGEGNRVEFNSMIDALNYMESLGWSFVQAYVTVDNEITNVRWLVCKDVVEGVDPYEGLLTKEMLEK